MRFASLGSGSRGNALVVESGDTRLLLDCGFGPRELQRRLARLGLAAEDFSAILVTHEHGDHSAGVFGNARRHDLEVVLTHGTLAAMPRDSGDSPRLRVIDPHRPFSIGDFRIEPFPVPHDAREPVQFVFDDGHHRLGVLTDAGCITAHIVDMLNDCAALVLECNHDIGMLESGSYPRTLKQRIRSRHGHLDNAMAADLLTRLEKGKLRHLVAAHLSEQNNTPQLAIDALAGALGCAPEWIGIATQEEGFAWRAL